MTTGGGPKADFGSGGVGGSLGSSRDLVAASKCSMAASVSSLSAPSSTAAELDTSCMEVVSVLGMSPATDLADAPPCIESPSSVPDSCLEAWRLALPIVDEVGLKNTELFGDDNVTPSEALGAIVEVEVLVAAPRSPHAGGPGAVS